MIANTSRRSGAVLEAAAFVAGFDDVAVVGETVEQRGRHRGIAEDDRPFAEDEIGGDDEGPALIKPADEVEKQLATGLSEREIAEFVEDDEVHAGQIVGDAALAAAARFGFEPVDEIGRQVKNRPRAPARIQLRAKSDRQMALAGAGSPYEHGVALFGEEPAAGETAAERLGDRRALEEIGEPLKTESSMSLASGSLGRW